jgi:hypothetical protein
VNEEVKLALKQAMLKSLPIFHQLSVQFQQPYPVWSKREDGGWQGTYQPRTDVFHVFLAAEKQLDKAASGFAGTFFSGYPEYGEGKLVGCAGLCWMQLAHDKSHILRKAIGCLWDRHGTFDCNESCIDAVVDEFAEFIDSSKIRIRFQTLLLNFGMSGSGFRLSENLVVRRLSEAEISDIQSGPVMGGAERHVFGGIHEFVIEGEIEGVKTFAGLEVSEDSPYQTARSQLDKAIICFRTFKEGQIGYDQLTFKFVKFCPLDVGRYGFLDRNVPLGTYIVAENEIPSLCEHARNIFGLREPAMEAACARLADAEARFRPQDQILDAVIGMEALLLAGLDREDRRSELKYRFSLNYSTLFNSPEERWRAYKVAKALYDHRSTIAHGGDMPVKDVRVGDEKLTLHETATRAKNTLRKLIHQFLPQAKAAPYKKSGFWERAYFGLPESKT